MEPQNKGPGMLRGGVCHEINKLGWGGWFMTSTGVGWVMQGLGGSCYAHDAELEWSESYRGGLDHAVKQPKKY